MRVERFTFEGASGESLAARLDLPAGAVRATALFAHCFACGKDIRAARRIAARLAGLGFAVLRFDFTGQGHSDGELPNPGFSANVGDVIAAARALVARGLAPGLLIGHSFGGAAVLAAAGRIESARAVATIGAPADPAHLLRLLGVSEDDFDANGKAEVLVGPRRIAVSREFVLDLKAADLRRAIASLRRALLVLHAPRDEIVGIENATEIFLAAKHPKSFVTLDDADHLLSRPGDAEYAAEVIAAWASRYLGIIPEKPPANVPEGVTRVAEADPDGFLQDVWAGPRHHLLADEPESFGGTDLGPSPYQLLAAALGACTSMTIRMYARRKGWPLEHVAVDVTHHRLHGADAEGAAGEGTTGSASPRSLRIDVFRRRIRLDGPLDEAQRARLLEIADRCPVHRTLTGEIRIETEPAPA